MTTANTKRSIYFWFLTLAGGLVLTWPALLNGFPLLFPDSGGYLSQYPYSLRARGYNLIVSITTGHISIWPLIIFQSLLTSLLLMRNSMLVLRHRARNIPISFLVLIGVAAVTDISSYTSWVMPDILASWLFLGLMLVILSPNKLDRSLATSAIVLSIISHNSNLLVAAAFLTILFTASFFARKYKERLKRGAKDTLFIILLAAFTASLVNYKYENRLSIFGTKSFDYTVGILTDAGIFSKTLDTACPSKQWDLCQHQEAFKLAIGKGNGWYLWSKNTPRRLLNNPKGQEELRSAIKKSMRLFPFEIIQMIIKNAMKQVVAFDNEHMITRDKPYADTMSNGVYETILGKYPRDFPAFSHSRQERTLKVRNRVLPFPALPIQAVISVIALLTLAFSVFRRKWVAALLLLAAFAFLLVNAFIVSAPAGVSARMQGRIVWLLSYCLFLAWASLFPPLKVRGGSEGL